MNISVSPINGSTDIIEIRYGKLSLEVREHFRFSVILILKQKKKWFKYAHEHTFPCVPYFVSQILLNPGMGNFIKRCSAIPIFRHTDYSKGNKIIFPCTPRTVS